MLRQLNTQRHLTTILVVLSLAGGAVWLTARSAHSADAAPHLGKGSLPKTPSAWRRELAWSRVREDDGGFVAVMPDGGQVELTLEPRLQHLAQRVLAHHRARYGAAVLLSVE